MYISRKEARMLMFRVDPGRTRWGWPVGLRDSAVLALLAAGLTAAEISRLHTGEISVDRGRLLVHIYRLDVALPLPLPVDLGDRVITWLKVSRLWGTAGPVFTGLRGPLTLQGIYTLVRRYRRRLLPRRSR